MVDEWPKFDFVQGMSGVVTKKVKQANAFTSAKSVDTKNGRVSAHFPANFLERR